ncbi:MAG: cell division protein FtsL [Myxococcota bacterium]
MTRRAKLLRACIVALALVAAGALAHVWIHLRVLQLAYDLARETKAIEEVEQTSRRLRAEIAFLKSPERLENVARERLHMAPLDPSGIRVVRAPSRGGSDRRRASGGAAARDREAN